MSVHLLFAKIYHNLENRCFIQTSILIRIVVRNKLIRGVFYV